MPADIKKRKRTEVVDEADVSLELSALAQGAEVELDEEDEEDGDDIHEDEEDDDAPESSAAAAARTKDATKSKKAKSKSKTAAKGIVFISRVPPGMTPSKIRHLMSRWGEVQRVYAQAKDGEWLPYPHGRLCAEHNQRLPATTPTMPRRRSRRSTSRPTSPRRGSSSRTRASPRWSPRCSTRK